MRFPSELYSFAARSISKVFFVEPWFRLLIVRIFQIRVLLVIPPDILFVFDRDNWPFFFLSNSKSQKSILVDCSVKTSLFLSSHKVTSGLRMTNICTVELHWFSITNFSIPTVLYHCSRFQQKISIAEKT